MQLRDILFTSIFAYLIYKAFSRPWVAILVWSWLSYMNPHRFCYGFAAFRIPFTLIIAIVTVLSFLLSRENKKFLWTRETILELLFCGWMVITTCFSFIPELSWAFLDRALKIQLMILLTYCVMKSRFRLEALVWTIVVSVGFYGVKGGLWTLLTGGGNRVQGPFASMIEGNNEIALALVMVLPLMRYLQLHTENRWIRRGFTVAQILTSIGVVGTYSRAGVLALGVVMLFQWWKSQHKLIFALALLLVAPPIIQFMPQQWKDRMYTLKTTDTASLDASAQGRLNAWHFAWNLANAHPITGGGFKVFQHSMFKLYAPDQHDVHDAHSIYFEVLAEQGFIGLAIFLSLGLCVWGTGRWVMRVSRRYPELKWAGDLATYTLVGLVGYGVGGAFASMAYFDLPYHMMSIIVLCAAVTRETIRSQEGRDYSSDLVVRDFAVPQEA